jgi:hypothetical protein
MEERAATSATSAAPQAAPPLSKRGRLAYMNGKGIARPTDKTIIEHPELQEPLAKVLAARLLLMLRHRVERAEAAERQIDEELKRRYPRYPTIVTMREACSISDTQLARFLGELNDRWGQPKRTVNDVNVAGGITPIRIVTHESPEAADAAARSDDAAQLPH